MLRLNFLRLHIAVLSVSLYLCACSDDPPLVPADGDATAEEDVAPSDGDDDAPPASTLKDAATPRKDAAASEPSSPDAGGSLLDAGQASTMDATAPAPADAGTPADASADAGPVTPALPKCMSGSKEACGTFVTNTGTEIPLGPYGAAMDVNVGKGFENRVNLLDTDAQCESFAIQGFGGSAEEAAEVSNSKGLDLKLYTVYRPAKWVDGEKYPIVSWGNGTCAKPEGYGALLRYVASHGYIVVAANSRWVGSGAPQKRGIDFLVAANADAKSPYYQKVDTTKVAAMGHSQGGQGTIAAASDERIDTVVIFNGGVSADKPFFAISGDRDVTADLNTTNLQKGIDEAPKGAWLFFHKIPERGKADGHLTLMTQPERVTGATVAWLSYLLSNDPASKEWLVGPTCKLCTQPDEFEYGQKGL